MLTSAQAAILKADIDAQFPGVPNTSDQNFAIAEFYNAKPVVEFWVWQTAVPIDVVTDAVVWGNMTPAQAPDGTQGWANRALQCQGKQFNLQNLMLGRTVINASKANIRGAFQDCLTQLPSKSDGTNQAAGWTAVQAVMMRTATRLEQLLATGTGSTASPATMGYEGRVGYSELEAVRS